MKAFLRKCRSKRFGHDGWALKPSATSCPCQKNGDSDSVWPHSRTVITKVEDEGLIE